MTLCETCVKRSFNCWNNDLDVACGAVAAVLEN